MKKLLVVLGVLIVIFMALLYWSVLSTNTTEQHSLLINSDTVDTINFKDHDSVIIAASTLYKANPIKTVIQGEQYRKAWETAIKVPIVFLDTLYGGVRITKEGGGKQTHSLKLECKNNIQYTLRSINKDPEALIPDLLKTLSLENIVVDGISAQHPYGAILVAELATYANVLNTHPKVVFVPKQNVLGKEYNEKYGNRLFLLEYETESDHNWTDLNDVETILETDDLQELKQKHKDSILIDERQLVRARLFDLIIGDWDRHAKQWGWVMQRTDGKLKGVPIPGDRDNAFFKAEGLIPTLLSNENVVPRLRPFEEQIKFMPGLVYPFDRYFLLKTPKSVFVEEAKALQSLLTDANIEAAFKVWPKAISELDKKEIKDKLIKRRNDIVKYAIEFKKEIERKGGLTEPLKGSEDIELSENLKHCFSCE
ncbi:hypothetical protein ES676_09975 [Bizionia saleffrena]|uniref:Uncharacterized protein n=1 Tax=Bizionia saleffrena TaxID=291189 RepID=A0A8H2LE45_9FLAO|nr:hypothetical protein [Bizionia saleffrena]TYB73073.1 hypothetical protein ES676_09975 [Bizionia saleffrena]